MKTLVAFYIILIWAASLSPVPADIYVWTDERGVKNFTNYAPPDGAAVFMVVKETPADSEIRQSPVSEEGMRLREAEKEIATLKERVADLQSEIARGQPAEAPAPGGVDPTADETQRVAPVDAGSDNYAVYSHIYGKRVYVWPYPYGHYQKYAHHPRPYDKYYRYNHGRRDRTSYYRHPKTQHQDRHKGKIDVYVSGDRSGSHARRYRPFGRFDHRSDVAGMGARFQTPR